MSDFAQTGLICTLQRLSTGAGDRLEKDLEALARERPIVLVLPCHAGELQGAALPLIREELRQVRWIREVIVSFNGLDDAGWTAAQSFFSTLPQSVRLLWNDGPQLARLYSDVQGGAAHGKGLNLWAAIGTAYLSHPGGILLTQDADVLSFHRENLARLAFAAADPELDFAFAKMYYSRATDRLYGRVTRLFLAPLLQGIVRCLGHHPLLDFLRSFRYPLAGEIAIRSELAAALPVESSWGVEIGMLVEVFRRIDPRTAAQVDGGGGYEHRHHPATEGGTLGRMAREIAATLRRALMQEGCGGPDFAWEALCDAYLREGELAVQRSAALARINGLPFDRASEVQLVEIFAREMSTASPGVLATLPSWNSLARQRPDWVETFRAAIALA